jgi:hypothetical protein
VSRVFIHIVVPTEHASNDVVLTHSDQHCYASNSNSRVLDAHWWLYFFSDHPKSRKVRTRDVRIRANHAQVAGVPRSARVDSLQALWHDDQTVEYA